jgi:DNA mismatch repair protein MSH5
MTWSSSTSTHSIPSQLPVSNTRLRPGLSLSSYGTNCASFSGIPKEVIERATLYTRIQSNGENLVNMIRGESDEEERRNLKVAEEVAKRFMSWDIDVSAFVDVRQNLGRILG